MTLTDYARMADDGCPHCPEHVLAADGYTVTLPSGKSVRVRTVLRLEDSPTHPPKPNAKKIPSAFRAGGFR